MVVQLSDAAVPDGWRASGREATVVPDGAGSIVTHARVGRAGDYEAWLGGSVRPRVELLVNGERVGEVRHELNNQGQYVRLGEARLASGTHRVEMRFAGADLRPGSGGRGTPVGPLVLSTTEAADSRLVRMPATAAGRLCGREWDWIEAG